MYVRYVCLMFRFIFKTPGIMGICCRLFGIMDKTFQKENILTAAFIQSARGFWRLNGINTHSYTCIVYLHMDCLCARWMYVRFTQLTGKPLVRQALK